MFPNWERFSNFRSLQLQLPPHYNLHISQPTRQFDCYVHSLSSYTDPPSSKPLGDFFESFRELAISTLHSTQPQAWRSAHSSKTQTSMCLTAHQHETLLTRRTQSRRILDTYKFVCARRCRRIRKLLQVRLPCGGGANEAAIEQEYRDKRLTKETAYSRPNCRT